MIIDAQNRFSNAQGITGTALSTDWIDQQELTGSPLNTTKDIGNGNEPLYLVVQVGTAFNTLTSLTITLESDSAADMATSATVHLSSGAIALASLTANTIVFAAPLPFGAYERYVRVRYTVGGSNPSTGTVTAFLTPDVQQWRAYRSASAV